MEYYKELLKDKSFKGIIVILDGNSNIIDVNDHFLSLLGFKLDEIKNKNIIDLIIPDEKSLFFDLVYNQGISNTLTLKFYHKSGAFRFFSFSIFSFDKHKILFGNTLKKDFLVKKYEYLTEKNELISNVFDNIVANDIKEVLSFHENSLSLLLDLMPVEVWVKDKIGKYVFINEALIKSTGMKFSEWVLKDDYQLFSAETAQSFAETDEMAKKTGKKISYNYETSDKKLSSFAEVTKIPLFNNTGKYIGLMGFSINTSYVKAAEILLQKEKDRLLYILDNVDGMVFEINSMLELVFISGKLRKLIGSDIQDKDLLNRFLDSSSSTMAREKLNLALNGEKISIDISIRGKTISFNLNPVKNDDGSYNIVGFGNVILKGGE